ncbi:MAG: ATP-binding protein, partial [Prevotellaceae bacterium]|nr:ATP-binding protein [Prevotellaceae bacterium]
SRPRRFGKSLLISTLQAYFEGQRDLFKGLAMERLETEWTEYPVLRFDMTSFRHVDKEQLLSNLNWILSQYERIYGKDEQDLRPSLRLYELVRRAYEQTGKQVVVLIDWYDAPMLDVVHEEDNFRELHRVISDFLAPLKSLEPYLRFVFITGITRFSQADMFGGLNNVKNISINEEYAAICGITEEEMVTQMKEGVERLAKAMGISFDAALEKLRQEYGGYHFDWPSPEVYSPMLLLNALSSSKIDSHCLVPGPPSYLRTMLRKFPVAPEKIDGRYGWNTDFDAPIEMMTDAKPLLYQSGYITIKGYERMMDSYLLGIPNKEMRIELMRYLLPEYVTPRKCTKSHAFISDLYCLITEGNIDEALQLLQTFLSTVPYTENTNYEGHYQSLLYVIFSLLGFYDVDIEVRTATGRIDMVLQAGGVIYLFELKLKGSAEEALSQIDLKNYPERFALRNLPVVKVGIGFDMERHTLSGWIINNP